MFMESGDGGAHYSVASRSGQKAEKGTVFSKPLSAQN